MKKQCNNGDLRDQDLSRWFHHSGLVRKKREAPDDMAKVNFVTIIFLLFQNHPQRYEKLDSVILSDYT